MIIDYLLVNVYFAHVKFIFLFFPASQSECIHVSLKSMYQGYWIWDLLATSYQPSDFTVGKNENVLQSSRIDYL